LFLEPLIQLLLGPQVQLELEEQVEQLQQALVILVEQLELEVIVLLVL
jgi:hypothetical protein